jgi:hypothetical protein
MDTQWRSQNQKTPTPLSNRSASPQSSLNLKMTWAQIAMKRRLPLPEVQAHKP